MNYQLAPFELSDLDDIEVQEKHQAIIPAVTGRPLVVYPLLVGRWSWTMWGETGRPLIACGILPNGYAWAIIGADMRRHMMAASRAVKFILEQHLAAVGTVFAQIDETYPAAVRWAMALGFKRASEGLWKFG